jgi:hypothetical protein
MQKDSFSSLVGEYQKVISMQKLEEALRNYAFAQDDQEGQPERIPLFVTVLRSISDLADYVENNMSADQKDGVEPIVSIIHRSGGIVPVSIGLYWNNKNESLYIHNAPGENHTRNVIAPAVYL